MTMQKLQKILARCMNLNLDKLRKEQEADKRRIIRDLPDFVVLEHVALGIRNPLLMQRYKDLMTIS